MKAHDDSYKPSANVYAIAVICIKIIYTACWETPKYPEKNRFNSQAHQSRHIINEDGAPIFA